MKNLLNKIINNLENAQLFDSMEFAKEFNKASDEERLGITQYCSKDCKYDFYNDK
jgi:hypothetical protein